MAWKSFQLRKRHWFFTVLEIIVPCLVLTNMHFLKALFNKSRESSPVSNERLFRFHFIHTPNTSETDEIMQQVKKHLGISNIHIPKTEKEMIRNLINISNENEQLNHTKICGFGIVFKNLNSSNVFKYNISNTSDAWPKNQLFQMLYLHDMKNLSLESVLNKLGSNWLLYEIIFPFLIILCFSDMYTNTIKIVIEEKHSGVKEFMKIMGFKSWMIWAGWVLHNFFVYIILITFITFITCFLTFFTDEDKVLNYTSPSLFWIILTIYMITIHFFFFAISSFFNEPTLAIRVCLEIQMYSFIIPIVLDILNQGTSISNQTILVLLPNVALFNAFKAISFSESQRKELQLSKLFTSINDDADSSVGFVLIILVIQCFLYGFIAWCMDLVMPGKYYNAKPLNFFCQGSNTKTKPNETTHNYNNNGKLFEKFSDDNKVGISVQNLYKRFGSCNAVNGVNMNLNKGQITALLGYNGAGKTTLISIITGLCTPTSGRVTFNGNDLFSNIDKYRDNFGVCLQHDILFSYLTTFDNLIFFGMVKGMTLRDAQSEGERLLKRLNIWQMKNELVCHLSGGIKRKLSITVSLVNSPNILILDEPTSGMDPKTRREIWDLLLSLRESRIILIATHSMEEADVLGDRIAIMNDGQIKCYGTSLFLKKIVGAGYNLKIVKEELCDENKMMKAIKQILPEAEEKKSLTARLVINLPYEHTNKFPDIFKLLETNKKGFCIKEMSISFTTIEDVFLRANSATENLFSSVSIKSDNENKLEKPLNSDDKQRLLHLFLKFFIFIKPMPKYISGLNLLINQLTILIEKKILYVCRNWWSIFILFLFGLNIMYKLITTPYNISSLSDSFILQGLNVSFIPDNNRSIHLDNVNSSIKLLGEQCVGIFNKNQAKVNSIPSNNITFRNFLIICGEDDIGNEKNRTISSESSIICMNAHKNSYLQYLYWNNESFLSTQNESIQLLSNKFNFVKKKTYLRVILLAVSVLNTFGHFIESPLNERVSGIKQIQMMSKLSPIVYWTSIFLWDYFYYIVGIIFISPIIFISEEYNTFDDFGTFFVLLILLLLYGLSTLFYTYVYSFFMKTYDNALQSYFIINSILECLFIFALVTKDIRQKLNIIDLFNFWNIFERIALIIPHCSFSASMISFLQIKNKKYKMSGKLSDIAESSKGYKNVTLKSYFESPENQDGILKEMLFLIFSSLLYITIILFLDYKIFARAYQYGFNTIFGTGTGIKEDNEDLDIIEEKKKVQKQSAAITQSFLDDPLSPVLLVDDLVKKFSYTFTGVRGISFSVSRGECFGLLGVNGAGKTTAFRILTGDTCPSKGDASIQTKKTYKLSSNMNEYVSMIGYCPQFDTIYDKLTVKESLKLMAILRGISPMNAKKHVDDWINRLSLDKYEDKLCGEYSSRNKRILNVAMALIGDPPVVFLDEPTSGLDPVAKSNLWKVLTSVKKKQAIVLTSHCMDECEALCDRLTIMVDGKMKCIGDIQSLKNRYEQGFTIMIKLRDTDNVSVEKLKADIVVQFTPNIHLKDARKGLLSYRITDHPLSKIFGEMKNVKDNYSVVEDYTISETTLEQVFIAYAKQQEGENKKSV